MSNKTLKENAKKTKLAPKYAGVIIVALVAAFALSFFDVFSVTDTQQPVATPVSSSGCAGLDVQNKCYSLERLTTAAQRTMGLSGRDSLTPQSGLLFVFPRSDQACMWMKDMKFNIDIVWTDNSKKITKIEQDLSPSTYPASYCQDNTKYVLELPSGDAQKLQLAIGQQLTF